MTDPKRELAKELYLQGKKYKEIADEVGVSLSAVKSWASRYWRSEKSQPKNKELQPRLQKKLHPNGVAEDSRVIRTQQVPQEISMQLNMAFL